MIPDCRWMIFIVFLAAHALPVSGKALSTPLVTKITSLEKSEIKLKWKADPKSENFKIQLVSMKTGAYTTHSIYDSRGNVETTIRGSALIPGKMAVIRIRTFAAKGSGLSDSKWSGKYRIRVAKNSKNAGKSKKARKTQNIRVLNKSRKSAVKPGKSVRLRVRAKGKLTFTTDAPDIARISPEGIIRVKKYGKVRIRIRAGKTDSCSSAVKEITWTFRPAAGKIRADSPSRGVLRMDWRPDRNADGYEIQYSGKASFPRKLTRSGYTKNPGVIHTSVSGLAGGTVCHVRVRSYILWKGKRLTGPWSTGRVRIR